MGDVRRAMVLVILMVMAILHDVSHGAVYKVGDSTGWTTIGNYNYKQWAATKTFHVGDTILFTYNAQFHNVMHVTHPEYKACNVSTPKATYTTGNDSITITNRGHHYFFCGVPGHCQSGQKVDINVARRFSALAPTPSSTVLPSPSNTSAIVPGTTPSNAVSSFCSSKTFFTTLGLVMTISAVFVSKIA